eukprot:CAMPEP_0182504716 /NCGR_PEP_ID=MMETSP1321-20130603/17738_1 /TAXON_ID=91990 /ORGANISM="Bolidomonas sp., Strain RCC1657" /LENGTH=78 /DNA_ID=CAMNT_0024710117 /DNA_START=36 /DNA_END=268 /DNA_ORIENTATION=-
MSSLMTVAAEVTSAIRLLGQDPRLPLLEGRDKAGVDILSQGYRAWPRVRLFIFTRAFIGRVEKFSHIPLGLGDNAFVA